MDEREQVKMTVLGILRAGRGRMHYADALGEYERRVGVGGAQAAGAFAQLVREMIDEKLIDYAADYNAVAPVPPITALWLRPRGEAKIGLWREP